MGRYVEMRVGELYAYILYDIIRCIVYYNTFDEKSRSLLKNRLPSTSTQTRASYVYIVHVILVPILLYHHYSISLHFAATM